MLRSTLRTTSFAVAFATTLSTLAAAQQPGTNVPTPAPPAAAAISPSGTAGTVGVSSSSAVIADPNEPVIDAATSHKTFFNRPLFFTGLIILAGSYGTAAVFGATTNRADDKKLVYPVVGPWMDLADRDCGAVKCPHEDTNKALLIGGGVLQGLGALGILMSLVIPEDSTRHWYLVGNEGTHIAPGMVGSGYGLGASGRF